MGVRRNICLEQLVISVRYFVPKTHYKGVITFPYTTFIGISGEILKKMLKLLNKILMYFRELGYVFYRRTTCTKNMISK